MVASRWGTSDTFVYDQIKAGKLAAFKLGGKLIRVKFEAVEEYEARAAVAAPVLDHSLGGVSGLETRPEPAKIARLIRATSRPR